MKTLQIFDPPMCCSTGICGPEVDPELVIFAGFVSQLAKAGVTVERYNLGQQPMAFAQNATVKNLLDKEGMEILPLTICDGEVKLKGRYPTPAEREQWKTEVAS